MVETEADGTAKPTVLLGIHDLSLEQARSLANAIIAAATLAELHA